MVSVRDCFTQTVVDIAWTPDGHTLLACSMDGTIAVLRLEEGELGSALTAQEMAVHMDRLYGDQHKQSGWQPPDNDACLDSEDEGGDDLGPAPAGYHAMNGQVGCWPC